MTPSEVRGQDHTFQVARQGQSVDVCQTGPSPVYDSGLMPVSIKGMLSRSGQSVVVCQTGLSPSMTVAVCQSALSGCSAGQVSQWQYARLVQPG